MVELPRATLIELNDTNGASEITYRYAKAVLDTFAEHLYGVQMGIAYGGGVERMAQLWNERGDVYGYDTFEDLHPSHLADSPQSREATCMDHWYRKEIHGTEKLSYDYQKSVLENFKNAHLIKGLVTEDSCKDLPKIHYAFLDMDLYTSMVTGYKAVEDKMVKDGYLLLHDVVTQSNLPRLYDWYNNVVLKDKRWQEVYKDEGTHLAVLRRV